MTQELQALLDVRGLVLHSMHRGDDIEGVRNQETGKIEPRAEYGFESFLESYILPILETVPPRNIIAVWDGGNEFRKTLFAGYKKTRHERDRSEHMQQQMDMLFKKTKSFLASIGVLQCVVKGVEADDVLGLLVDKLPGHQFLYTVDKDLLCLRKEGKCTVFVKNDPLTTMPHTYWSGDNKYTIQVPTHLVTLFKSMIGDPSDEYPGVAGFGPKKWEALVEKFGYDGLEELEACVQTGKFDLVKEALDESQDKGLGILYEKRYDWQFQYGLARLHPELCEGMKDNKPVEIQWLTRVPDKDRCIGVLEWAGAMDMYNVFEPLMPTMTLVTEANLQEAADHFIAHVKDAPTAGYDFESVDELQYEPFQKAQTKGDYVDVLSQSITGCSFCYGSNYQHVIYLAADHANTENIDDMMIWEFMDEAQAQGVKLIAHNAPFEIALTDTNFEKALDSVIDTRIEALAVDENEPAHLKGLSLMYLRYQQQTYKQTLEDAGVENMKQLSGEQVLKYGCDDSLVTAWLHRLFDIIMHLEGTNAFCNEYEFPVADVLYEGFESGLKVDMDRLAELAAEDQTVIDKGNKRLREMLSEHCSEANDKAAMILYDDLAQYENAKLAAAGKSKEFIDDKLLALKERCITGSRYTPLVETKKEVNFKPTKIQLNKVISKLDFGCELEGVAKSKINEWVATARMEEGATSEQLAFTDMLVDALPAFKKREGDAYAAFSKFCEGVLSDDVGTTVTGDELNFGSPQQMQLLLYGKLGLPIRVRSKVQMGSGRDKLGFQGSPATNDKAVEMSLAEDCQDDDWRREVVLLIRDVKSCMTRFGLFYDPYPLWVHPRDGRVHGQIQNCGTVTRRFTGSSPNELQIPSRDGGRVRTMILPKDKHHVILSPDLNGEELRIAGSEALDPVMVEAYTGEHRRDIHSLTASAIAPIMLPRYDIDKFGELMGQALTYDDFTAMLKSEDEETAKRCKSVRYLAKTCNFLIIYAGQAYTLALNLGVPSRVAEALLDKILTTYPRLQPWQQESIEFARTHGYVLTAYGNRRHLGKGILSDNNAIRAKHERQAVNSQVQGTGSDIMKIILTEMKRRKVLQQAKGSLIVPPYDEVAVSVPMAAAWDTWLEMKEIMTITPPGHAIPQMPELKGSALNWGTCVELGAEPTEDQLLELFNKQLSERNAA